MAITVKSIKRLNWHPIELLGEERNTQRKDIEYRNQELCIAHEIDRQKSEPRGVICGKTT